MAQIFEKNYIIWNGFNTKENNILIEQLPMPPKAEERKEFFTIEGRNGYLTLNRGCYNSITYEVQLNLYNTTDVNEIKRFFKGSGSLLLSCVPDVTYDATITGMIEFERVVGEKRTCVVTFELQPLARVNNVSTIEILGQTTLYNRYNSYSYPRMRVYGSGSGKIYVNDIMIQLTEINSYVDLDSELEMCYKGSTNCNNKMIGEFPLLLEGENTIKFEGGITKININPSWRTL